MPQSPRSLCLCSPGVLIHPSEKLSKSFTQSPWHLFELSIFAVIGNGHLGFGKPKCVRFVLRIKIMADVLVQEHKQVQNVASARRKVFWKSLPRKSTTIMADKAYNKNETKLGIGVR